MHERGGRQGRNVREEKDDVEVSGEVMRRRRKGREDRVGLVSRGERTIM